MNNDTWLHQARLELASAVGGSRRKTIVRLLRIANEHIEAITSLHAEAEVQYQQLRLAEMSLLDRFAMGAVALHDTPDMSATDIAENSYRIANACIEVRNRKQRG